MQSYCTTEYADEYFAGRLHSGAWYEAAEADKEKAIQQATRAIDRQPLKGWKADPEQELQFPRWPLDEVPESVKIACCEEALALLERGNSQRRRLQQEGVESFSVGGLTETFVASARGGGLISQEAKELLRPWLLGAVSIT